MTTPNPNDNPNHDTSSLSNPSFRILYLLNETCEATGMSPIYSCNVKTTGMCKWTLTFESEDVAEDCENMLEMLLEENDIRAEVFLGCGGNVAFVREGRVIWVHWSCSIEEIEEMREGLEAVSDEEDSVVVKRVEGLKEEAGNQEDHETEKESDGQETYSSIPSDVFDPFSKTARKRSLTGSTENFPSKKPKFRADDVPENSHG